MNKAFIIFFGEKVTVTCDSLCEKAWGINSRPKHQAIGPDTDDFEFLSDGELGWAPIRPGTWEGLDTKPASPDDFPNRWCVRECERCSMRSGV